MLRKGKGREKTSYLSDGIQNIFLCSAFIPDNLVSFRLKTALIGFQAEYDSLFCRHLKYNVFFLLDSKTYTTFVCSLNFYLYYK